MALGNTYNNNKKSGNAEPTVYSNLRATNAKSEVDKTSLSFIFWNGLLGIKLSPVVIEPKSDTIKIDNENAITIWLTVFKAALLSSQIDKFLAGEESNIGVSTNSGIITLSQDHGGQTILAIRKLDENGNVLSSFAYEVRRDYHYSILNLKENNGTIVDFDKVYDETIEISLLKIQLDEYVKSQSMAMAYSVIQASQRGDKRLEYKIDKIAGNLGVDTSYSSGGKSSSPHKSYFDNLATADNSDFE